MSLVKAWHGRQHGVHAQQQQAHQHSSGPAVIRPASKGSSRRYRLAVACIASVAPAGQQAQQLAATDGQKAGRTWVDPRGIDIKRRAKAARLSGNPQLALQLLLEGMQQYPKDMHLVAAAASAAAKLGDAELAFELLSPALQEKPHNVNLLTAAAAAHTAAGDQAAARQCYECAAAAQPTNAVVLTAWGVMEAAADNPAAAVKLFKQAVAAQPQHAPAYVAWAGLEAERGRPWEARSLYQQAHKCCPGHVPNLHAWAELEAADGQWLLAIKLLEQALAADRQHLPSWMALGKARWALGDSAAARRVYQAAVNSLGPRPELLNQWVTLEQQAQRIPAARAVLGFMDTALQQQQQQQQQQQASSGQLQDEAQLQQLQQVQQVDAASQASEQQGQQQQQQQQQQQRRRRMRRQSKQASPGTSAEAAQDDSAGSSSSNQPAADIAVQLTGNGTPAGADTAVPDADGSRSSSSSSSSVQMGDDDALVAAELQEQLDQLVTTLNSLGPTNRLPQQAAAAAAAGREAATDGENFSQQQQQRQQQQQVHLPTYPMPPQGLQQHIPALASAAAMEHRAGNLARALKLYNAALQLAPNNPKLLHSLAQLHMQRRDRAAAEEQLRALEALQPGNGFLCYSRGLLAQQEGQLSLAKQWYEKGMKAPGSEPALLNFGALAELHVFMGDPGAAREVLSAGLASRRPTSRFLRTAALLERRLGNATAAAQLLGRAVARAPRDYRSWLAWAVLERRRGNFSAAARCFQRGTACAPCNPHIWYAWAAMTWHDLRDVRAARRLYEQATTHCPRNAPLWMEWAMLEWDEAGNADRARQLFQAGASVAPSYQHPPLYQAWAEREAAVGEHERAQQLTRDAYEVAKAAQQRVKGPQSAQSA